MSDETTAAAPIDEPDTPSGELDQRGFGNLVALAEKVAELKAEISALERDYEKELPGLVAWMKEQSVHGIRLPDGTAVRRAWSVHATAKPDPAKLRGILADAPEYIVEVVDMAKLREAYPTVWEALGKAKREETIAVRRLKKAGESP